MSPLAMYNLRDLWDRVSPLLADLVVEDKLTKFEALYISYILGVPAKQGAKSVIFLVNEENEIELSYSDEELPLDEFKQLSEEMRLHNLTEMKKELL